MGSEDFVGFFRDLFEEGHSPLPTTGLSLDSRVIPGYEILGRLGKGGMGAVLKARQVSLDRFVAIKLLKPELSRDPEYVQRFVIEARTAGKLRHLNIVSALDCGSVKEFRFMVMELVEGKSLDAVLKERGMLDERVALGIIKQIAEGLEYAWKHGIIHRDIKPQNVLMTPEGVAKICDLGLAKSVRRDLKLTSTGYINCTPTHASPEQAKGERALDCRTDIYSLGITFYQLVTGELPFTGSSPADYFIKHATAPRGAPMDRNPCVSRRVNDLILRMIDPDPERRPATPGAIVEAIRRIQSTPEEKQVIPPAEPDKKPAPAVRDVLKAAGIQVAPDWEMSVTPKGSCAVVRLAGRLNDSFDFEMTKQLTKLIEKGMTAIVIDLSGLNYMNSRGVSAFIAVVDEVRAKGGDLKLAGAKPQSKLVLARLGITLIIQHLESVEEAVEAFRTTPIYGPEDEAPAPVLSYPKPEHMASQGAEPPIPAEAPLPSIGSPPKPPTIRREEPRSQADRKGSRQRTIRLLVVALIGAVGCTTILSILLLSKHWGRESSIGAGDLVLKARSLTAGGSRNAFQQESIYDGVAVWMTMKRVDPSVALENYVEGRFLASPGVTYRAWVYIGLRSVDSGVAFCQTTDGSLGPDGAHSSIAPGAPNAAPLSIPPTFVTRSQEGWRWGWVAIPLPQSYEQPGLKSIRILTDRAEFAVRYLLVASTRTQMPDEETARSIERVPGSN